MGGREGGMRNEGEGVGRGGGGKEGGQVMRGNTTG